MKFIDSVEIFFYFVGHETGVLVRQGFVGKSLEGFSHPNVGETVNMHSNDNVKFSTNTNQDLKNS